jgi:alkanesulfonate monooxygenase SsuD/methylene tetrahydromethanopterin reductase-like flavin-dependent oxidoreductase (luciferase family)
VKKTLLTLGVAAVLATGCTTSTVRSTQLAEGAALMAIEPVKAHVVVDTTATLQAVSQTRTILGLFRSGDREFAEYPGMVFRRGPGMRERKAAIHKALKGTDFDVMVNPKYIVQEKRRPFVRTMTVQVAGYGGHLVFDQPEP